MSKSFLAVIIALCFAVIASIAEDGNAMSLREINRLIGRKKYEEAEAAIREELPGLKGTSYYKGLLILARLITLPARAEMIYEEVVSSGGPKESTKARIGLAKIYYATGNYEKAADILRHIPQRAGSSDRIEARYFSALVYKQLGDYELSRRNLAMVDRGKYMDWSYLTLGELDMQDGRIEDAITRYETIAGSHSNPIAGFKLGECYEIMGQRDKAVSVYRTLLHQFPNSLEAPNAQEKIRRLTYLRQAADFDAAGRGGEIERQPEESHPDFTPDGPVYTLQFGAFMDRGNAIKYTSNLSGVIRGLRVERVEIAGSIWHRVRYGRFSTREEAVEESERLLEKTGYSSEVLISE